MQPENQQCTPQLGQFFAVVFFNFLVTKPQTFLCAVPRLDRQEAAFREVGRKTLFSQIQRQYLAEQGIQIDQRGDITNGQRGRTQQPRPDCLKQRHGSWPSVLLTFSSTEGNWGKKLEVCSHCTDSPVLPSDSRGKTTY